VTATYRIGVDVGGTNTDAVVLDGASVIEWEKVVTTKDVSGGIRDAIGGVLKKARLPASEIRAVMVGTTHFTNALVERRGLAEVGVIRASLPAGDCLPPLFGWPVDLRRAIGDHTFVVHGGHEFNGRVLEPLNLAELDAVAEQFRHRGIQTAAITATWSPVDSSAEKSIAVHLEDRIPGLKVTLSSEIGGIGLIERENGAVLNASIALLAERVVKAMGTVVADSGIDAPLWITQNDGTLMPADLVAKYPAAALGSGPTNSMRGAAFLSGLKDAIVVDIGGTTTDAGLIHHGFPQQATMAMNVAGVRTNFRMPDVSSIGLGGGSLVSLEGPIKVGPESVGYRLTEEALVFGGGRVTATDIAAAAGLVTLGTPQRTRGLPQEAVGEAINVIRRSVETLVDRAKVAAGDLPVVLVGGGSILVGDVLEGASHVVRHRHGNVANAIGAAMAQVSGNVDRVFALDGVNRETILADVVAEAQERALALGAIPESLRIVDLEEIPLGEQVQAARVRAKVIGDLSFAREGV
jgi:N-methylhydantoinase A/oxoprolinase/acetone carboxylase beta subunit